MICGDEDGQGEWNKQVGYCDNEAGQNSGYGGQKVPQEDVDTCVLLCHGGQGLKEQSCCEGEQCEK